MSTTQQEVKVMKKDITQIKNMLADHMDGAPSNGQSKTVFNKEDLQQMAHQAGQGVRAFVSAKQQELGNAKEACENTIKERPFTSAAVAFAGGVLVTTLLKGK